MSANLLCVDTVRPCPRHICLVQPALSMCVAKKDDLIDRIVGKLQVLDRLTKKGLAGRKTSFFFTTRLAQKSEGNLSVAV